MTKLPARTNRALLLTCLFALTGCTAGTDTTGDDSLDLSAFGGKNDLAELAKPLTLGEPMAGEVAGRAFALFSFAADEGDVVRVEVTRTSGDYDPKTELFTASGRDISMDEGSFERTRAGNAKTFTIRLQGKQLLAVRPSYYRGAGEFSLSATCVGGPCAGEGPGSDEEMVIASGCIGRARSCAFSRLASSGVSNPTQALDLLTGCLDTVEHNGHACAGSCATSPGAEETCNQIVGSIQWYADKDLACHQVVDGCFTECIDNGEYSRYLEEDELEFWMTDEAVCWNGPEATTSCDEFARGHESCGGTEHKARESFASCMSHCEATYAYFSETDDICGESCLGVCDDVRTDCEASCGFGDGGEGDHECYGSCVESDYRASDDRGWGCEAIR